MFKKIHKDNRGFSLVELIVGIVLLGIVVSLIVVATDTTVQQYSGLQKSATSFGNLAFNTERIVRVIRGTTGIIDAQENTITLYAYFDPNDQYVSLVKYYLSADGSKLLADVTPMTANPPVGTPLTAELQTKTIITPYAPGNNGESLFYYLDESYQVLSMPIVDLNDIKQIGVNLFVPNNVSSENGVQSTNLVVNLRNRKTNL